MAEDILEGVDVIDPPKKIVYVAGEALDFSFVPTRATLQGMRIIEGMDKKTLPESDGFEQMIELLSSVCSKTNPKITKDWFLDNTSLKMIMELGTGLAGIDSENQEESSDSAKNLPSEG